MKSVLISMQPYWVFLIIAEKMGWQIDRPKTVEVRKNYPKKNWNNIAKIYCSKDKKSFAKIPKEYQPLMKPFLGKVIGEFRCDRVTGGFWVSPFADYLQKKSCLSYDEANAYANGKPLFAWHISNLVIYDKPRELSEFFKACDKPKGTDCSKCIDNNEIKCKEITRPPQSWCYVESEVEGE